MFTNVQTVLIVKGEGKEAKYAQYLSQLISGVLDFDSTQPITEAEYKTSFLTIDNIPKGKIIFFGNGNEAKLQSKAVNWQYDCFGMKYGWLGDRCVITADQQAIGLKEQHAFAEYYNSKVEEFRSINKELGKIYYSEIATLKEDPSTKDLLDMPYDEFDDPFESGKNPLADGMKKVGNRAFIAMAKLLTQAFIQLDEGLGNIMAVTERGDIWERQYELLVCEFFLHGLSQFMENANKMITKEPAIIVYDTKDAEFAHLLLNLIQQYSNYNAIELTEKMFIDNAKNLSVKNKIIFLGKTKSSKERWLNTHRHILHEHGMRYGYVGNHAFIYVTQLKKSERDAFVLHYTQKAKEYEDAAKDYAERNDSCVGKNVAFALNVALALKAVAAPVLIWRLPAIVTTGAYAVRAIVNGEIGAGADRAVNQINNILDLTNYQYHLLLREFVFNDLIEFMEA